MIIEQNGNREDKPLCHVAMVAKFLDLNTTVFPQIWQEKTKKTDMCDFPLHDCTATQESNKTVTKQDTGTTQQQKMIRQAVLGHMDTREKRSAHACLPCFRREFASRNYTRYQNKLDSGREIQKSKLHTQKISLEIHEHKVY